jgi:alpha-L-fucosidase
MILPTPSHLVCAFAACIAAASAAAADPPVPAEPPILPRSGFCIPLSPHLAQPIDVAGRKLAVPTPDQAAWQNLEVGMFIHLAPQTWQDKESDDLSIPASAINPEKLDTDQWVRVAESMGAKYIVFVAKHEGGFCWWPTSTTDYSVKNSPWRAGKGDVLKDLAASCKSRGMKLGVYLSPQDRTHHAGVGGKIDDPSKQLEYQLLYRTQLTEVLSTYGDMVEVWFDGSITLDVCDILERRAPNAMIFQGPQATIRWVGNEDGVSPYDAWTTVKSGANKWGDYTARDSDQDGDCWLPIECDARLRNTWFWRTDNENTIKSVRLLMEMYEQSVGHGATLLLNNTPDRTGLIPAPDAKRTAEFGAEIARVYGLGSAIADSSGKGSAITAQPSSPAIIDRIVLMEDISRGERIRAFQIDALIGGQWTQIADGTVVGHNRIVRIAPTKVESIRVRITESVAEPTLRRVSLHRASQDRPSPKDPAP